MSRYEPTADERAAIDMLTVAGYAVVRQRTYDGLRERVTIAEHERDWSRRDSESAERWAIRESDEMRRLSDRLNRVVAAAAAQGVTIQAINQALGTTHTVHPAGAADTHTTGAGA